MQISGGGQPFVYSRQPAFNQYKQHLLLFRPEKSPPRLLVRLTMVNSWRPARKLYQIQKTRNSSWQTKQKFKTRTNTVHVSSILDQTTTNKQTNRHVKVPYCTSDTWAGGRNPSEETNGYAFHGKTVFRSFCLFFLGFFSPIWMSHVMLQSLYV